MTGKKLTFAYTKGMCTSHFILIKTYTQLRSHLPALFLKGCWQKVAPESIVESYYSTMRHQQQPSGQSDEILTQPTKLSWCLPSLRKCEDIIDESVKLYHKGDKNIRAHRMKIFYSDRARSYDVSKVVDRVEADLRR